MRIIEIDNDLVFPILDTAFSTFAVWVNISQRDIPKEIHVVVKKTHVIGLNFLYCNEQKVCNRKATPNVTMYCFAEHNVIVGFDVPICDFNKEICDLILWLEDEQRNINNVVIRNNYKLISTILHLNINDLFVPSQ